MPLTKFRKIELEEAFTFTYPSEPCTVWSSGDHIVSAFSGLCRCGKQFKIVEVIKETNADET